MKYTHNNHVNNRKIMITIAKKIIEKNNNKCKNKIKTKMQIIVYYIISHPRSLDTVRKMIIMK